MVLRFLVTLPVDCRVDLLFFCDLCFWLCFRFFYLFAKINFICSTQDHNASLLNKLRLSVTSPQMQSCGLVALLVCPTGPMSWLPLVTNWSSGARFLWFFMALQEKIKSLRNAAKDQPISPNVCPQNPSLDNKVEEFQWNMFFHPTATNRQLMPIAP